MSLSFLFHHLDSIYTVLRQGDQRRKGAPLLDFESPRSELVVRRMKASFSHFVFNVETPNTWRTSCFCYLKACFFYKPWDMAFSTTTRCLLYLFSVVMGQSERGKGSKVRQSESVNWKLRLAQRPAKWLRNIKLLMLDCSDWFCAFWQLSEDVLVVKIRAILIELRRNAPKFWFPWVTNYCTPVPCFAAC
jgi:hypothetical protein